MPDYMDFDLLIERAGAEYRAHVRSPAGEASVTFSLPFSESELQHFRSLISHGRRGLGTSGYSALETVKAFGGRLFAAVFDNEIGVRLEISLFEAYNNGLRIRLQLNDVPELADLPWEYLYDPDFGFLSLSHSHRTAIVRAASPFAPHPVLAMSLPLRVLVVTSSSDGYQILDVEREWIALRAALSALECRGLVSIERLEEGSLRDLRERLRQEKSHIVHFIGSGGFDKETRDGFLLMRDQNHPDQRVSAQTLGRVLLDSPSTRLAILTGGQGAVATGSDPFSATAQTLVRQGLPAVIGIQSKITDQASIAFARQFYGALADGAPVDYALTESRIAMALHEDNLDWGAPILYLTSSGGRIFDLDDNWSVEPPGVVGCVDSSIGFVRGASRGIFPIPDAPAERRINVWVRERAELAFEPLKVGESYTLNLGVGAPVTASLVRDPYAVVPDSDVPESGLETKWVITSESVELASSTPDVLVTPMTSGSSMAWVANFSLHIPRRGDSSTCTLGITPRYAAEARLEVMIFVGAEQYRKFTINLAVDDVATRALSGPQLSPATVSDDCTNAPLAHQNLGTTHEWTTPPGRISICVVSADKAYVTGDAGPQPVNGPTDWQGAPSMVAGPMQNVRSSAEKFRARWEHYLNNIDAADLSQRLNPFHFSPQYDWSALRDDSDILHQQEWQSVALSPELRDLAYDGHRLYESFFPLGSELRSWLDALQPSWRINITWQPRSGGGFIPHVPWGLMYQPALPVAGQPIDPMGFLGLRFRIDYTAHPVNAKSKALGRVEDAYRSHFLYWGNDPQDLTGAEARWQQQQWGGWPKQVFVPKDPAEKNPKATLLSLLDSPSPNPAAILYLFCQCSVGDGNDPVLRFGDTLQPADIVRRSEIGTQLLTDQPLVFANACTTGAADPYMANELESVFFQRGCRAYIGTESKVPIQLASRFASAFFNFFYRKVDSQPMAAGEAVAQARLLLWTQYKNIGGLFYNYVNLYELFMAQDSEVLSLRR